MEMIGLNVKFSREFYGKDRGEFGFTGSKP